MLKQTGGVADKVDAIVRPTLMAMGLRLWDVRFEKEGPDWYLRVLIERDELMDTDTCEAASRAIDPLLEKADLIEQGYYLEVGSPGIGRRLTRPEHFDAYKGHKVAALLIRPDANGEREVSGILLRADGEDIVLETAQGETAISTKLASYFKLCDDEDLFSKQSK